MKFSLASLFAGLVFGLGLIVSGMANPEKVLGFLDIAGAWDPSLAFVMGGAIMVGVVAFAVARKRTLSFLGFHMKMPTSNHIDKRLILGGLMFGIGWGIAGFVSRPRAGRARCRRNQGGGVCGRHGRGYGHLRGD